MGTLKALKLNQEMGREGRRERKGPSDIRPHNGDEGFPPQDHFPLAHPTLNSNQTDRTAFTATRIFLCVRQRYS